MSPLQIFYTSFMSVCWHLWYTLKSTRVVRDRMQQQIGGFDFVWRMFRI